MSLMEELTTVQLLPDLKADKTLMSDLTIILDS